MTVVHSCQAHFKTGNCFLVQSLRSFLAEYKLVTVTEHGMTGEALSKPPRERERAWWKRQPLKVEATYMNIYLNIWHTNLQEKGGGDSGDLMARSTALHTDQG